MLFFELFPAFMVLVSIVAGVALFLADQRARRRPEGDTNADAGTHEP